MLKYQIEVILSDDCSTESYQQEIQPFFDKLLIKQVKTDYNYCPSNTRQRGVENATGKWIIFSDHDDAFFPNTFSAIKATLKKEEAKHKENLVAFYTSFVKTTENPDQVLNYFSAEKITGWTHGKFFNLDNFWKKYNIHYIKDLTSHQDVSINTQISCILACHPELQIIRTPDVCFRWIYSASSLSNKTYIQPGQNFQRPFLDIFLTDYLDSTGNIVIQKYYELKPQTQEAKDFFLHIFLDTTLIYYFYHQFAMAKTETRLQRNFIAIKQYIKNVQKITKYNIYDIYNYYKHHPETYAAVARDSLTATDCIMATHTFIEWLELVYNY